MTIELTGSVVVEAPETTLEGDGTFVFENQTGAEICDLQIHTNRTWGNDPDVREVEISTLDENGRKQDSVASYEGGDTTALHIDFDPCVTVVD